MDATELRRILALASAFKEGDLAVGGTTDERQRADAREALLHTPIAEIHATVLIDDGVTDALQRARARQFDAQLSGWTIADLRRTLLDAHAAKWSQTHSAALGSEAIAAVTKVMTDDELSTVALALSESPHRFGSRIQPNSAGDDEQEILFSILEGLSYGCGDVVIGLNPAADDLDSIVRLEQLLEQVVRRLHLPTRYCVLSDIVKQHEAQRATKVAVGFQSLAGTSKALAGMVGLDVDGIAELARSFEGLYFETGQGSEVTNGIAEGVDMVTLESRTYGVARSIGQQTSAPWLIVNDVAGFIGPEVFRSTAQLERACLEDTVMGRLHGLTMGLDVCATFHMGIAPGELRRLTARIAERAMPSYLMAVAGNADPMLGYLTTSFRDHPRLRRQTGRSIAAAMQKRLAALGVAIDASHREPETMTAARLYAEYMKAGGDRRSTVALVDEGLRTSQRLRDRGLDLGIDDEAAADERLEAIYANARAALYAVVDPHVIADVSSRSMHVRTAAGSRDDYLAHPPAGERLRDDDARAVAALYSVRRPDVQIVVSDGLNANAVNEQLRPLLPELRRTLSAGGRHVGEVDVVVQNGRVRVGYEIGGLTGASIVIHLIGERPGTGLNTLSAYVTYGLDPAGRLRWSRDLDHSVTTAVCGIHPRGKPPKVAGTEIARVVARMLELRKSGVALASGR
jgi:ethanolamine ammonia-lyase large subunit